MEFRQRDDAFVLRFRLIQKRLYFPKGVVEPLADQDLDDGLVVFYPREVIINLLATHIRECVQDGGEELVGVLGKVVLVLHFFNNLFSNEFFKRKDYFGALFFVPGDFNKRPHSSFCHIHHHRVDILVFYFLHSKFFRQKLIYFSDRIEKMRWLEVLNSVLDEKQVL